MLSKLFLSAIVIMTWLSGAVTATFLNKPLKASLFRADIRNPHDIETHDGFTLPYAEQNPNQQIVWGTSKDAVVALYRNQHPDQTFFLYYVDIEKFKIRDKWLHYEAAVRASGSAENKAGHLPSVKATAMDAATKVPMPWQSLKGYQTVEPEQAPSGWVENEAWRKTKYQNL